MARRKAFLDAQTQIRAQVPRRHPRPTTSNVSRLAWREFMLAHVDWYRRNTPYQDYQIIWRRVAKADWDNLPAAKKRCYANAKITGVHRVTGREPPTRANGWALPPQRITPQTTAPQPVAPQPVAAQPLIAEAVAPQSSAVPLVPRDFLDPIYSGVLRHLPPVESSRHPWHWDDPGHEGDADKPDGISGIESLPEDNETHIALDFEHGEVQWTRVRSLGWGSYGAVDVWIKHDNFGNVFDRMAIKTVSFARHPLAEKLWDQPRTWYSWPEKVLPAEVAAMRVANKTPTCSFLVGYRGFRVFAEDLKTYRIAMPPAEFGDMWEFLKTWTRNSDKLLKSGEDKIPTFPEALLFDILAALMTSGKFMAERNMLHSDYKVQNILLEANDDDMKCFVPLRDRDSANGWGMRPVMTDFGLAKPFSSKAFKNPEEMVGWGTQGTLPPEQVVPPGGIKTQSILRSPEDITIGPKAMLYSIAATFFTIMHASSANKLRAFAGNEDDEAGDLYRSDAWNRKEPHDDVQHIEEHFRLRQDWVAMEGRTENPSYEALKSILTRCLRFLPSNRPTFDEVLQLIEQARPSSLQDSQWAQNLAEANWATSFPWYPGTRPATAIEQDLEVMKQALERDKKRENQRKKALDAAIAARKKLQQKPKKQVAQSSASSDEPHEKQSGKALAGLKQRRKVVREARMAPLRSTFDSGDDADMEGW